MIRHKHVLVQLQEVFPRDLWDLLIIEIAWNASIHGAFVGNWVRVTNDDEWWLFQKCYANVEFFRHALRRHVTTTRPYDIFDVQTVPGIPCTNLKNTR